MCRTSLKELILNLYAIADACTNAELIPISQSFYFFSLNQFFEAKGYRRLYWWLARLDYYDSK
jgi:hypothetical protein